MYYLLCNIHFILNIKKIASMTAKSKFHSFISFQILFTMPNCFFVFFKLCQYQPCIYSIAFSFINLNDKIICLAPNFTLLVQCYCRTPSTHSIKNHCIQIIWKILLFLFFPLDLNVTLTFSLHNFVHFAIRSYPWCGRLFYTVLFSVMLHISPNPAG